jgi:hypothetical protein
MLYRHCFSTLLCNILSGSNGINGTHQLLVYDAAAADVTILGENITTIKKNREALLQASREADLEVNTEKTKHMLLSRHQNVGRS